MIRFLSAAAVLIVSLAGCASYPDVNRQRLENMPQRYVQFDAVIGWEVRSTTPETVIDGEFKNIRYPYMTDVEVWVAVLDRAGKATERSASFVLPRMLQMNQTAPFTLKLKTPVAPGTKLRFTYKYSLQEGSSEGGGDVGNWMQSFVTEVPRI